MRIAFADITDFAEFGVELTPDIDAAGFMQVDSSVNIKMRKRNYLDFKNHDQVDGGLICEVSLNKNGMKLKLEDRQKVLAWLVDYFNLNPMNKHKIAYDNAVLKIREKETALKEW